MKKLPLFVFLILLLFAIFIFLNNNFPPFQFITSSVQSIFGGPKSSLYDIRNGSASNSDLKKENEELTKKLINYQRVLRDNDALRSQFDTQETSSYTLMPVKIIGFLGNGANPSDLIIDHGSANGLKTGMGVIVKNNLVGKIDNVSANFSKVILISNQNFKIIAKSSDTAAAGVASGNDDFILFDKVSIKDTLNKNSFLLTSGNVNSDGFGIPPDLVIGKIISVNKSPNLPFQTAKIFPLINFSKLETVFVVEKF